MKHHYRHWMVVGAVAVLGTGCGTVTTAAVRAHHHAKKSATLKTARSRTPSTAHQSTPASVSSNDTATTVTLLNGSHETVVSGPWPTWPASWDQTGKWSNGQTIPTVRGYAFGVPGTPAPQVLPTVIPHGVSAHGMTAQVDKMGQIAARAVIAESIGSIAAYTTDWKTNVTQNTGPYAGQPAQVALAKDANQWFGPAASHHVKVYMSKALPVFAGGLLSSNPTFEVFIENVASNVTITTPSVAAGAYVVTLQGNAITGMTADQVAPTLNSASVNYTPPAWWQWAEQHIAQPAPHSLY